MARCMGPGVFTPHVGAVMVVHLAFATLLAQTERREGSFGKMKLSPLAKAQRELLHAEASPSPEDPGPTAVRRNWPATQLARIVAKRRWPHIKPALGCFVASY